MNKELKTSFVVCKVGSEGSKEREHADTVYDKIISKACKQSGMDEPVREDKKPPGGILLDRIHTSLRETDLVIADLFGAEKGNACYEVGYRAGLGMPLILMCERIDDLPSDLVAHVPLVYSLETESSISDAVKRLAEAIATFDSEYKSKPDEVASKTESTIKSIIDGSHPLTSSLIQKRLSR